MPSLSNGDAILISQSLASYIISNVANTPWVNIVKTNARIVLTNSSNQSILSGNLALTPGQAIALKSTCPFCAGSGTRLDPIRAKSTFIPFTTSGANRSSSNFLIRYSGTGCSQISFSVLPSPLIPPLPEGMVSLISRFFLNSLNILKV